jgi:NAD-dependent dihydropyrimidine dehydrogenase PreA subunit/flavodoxin
MIFYFSGTGNTRWAAQQLAESTQEQLLFIPDELKGECVYELCENERLGFCFPVHGWQPPHIVREFISRMTILHQQGQNSATTYAYALCTCGDSIGLAMNMLQRQLHEKGITLQATISLIMPESYVCLPFMYTDTPQHEQEKISTSSQELSKFCDVVRECRSGYHQLVRGAAPWLISHVIGGYFNNCMISDRKFTVDTDLCLHCGQCAKVCPVGDITLVDDTPTWKNDSSCTCCLSCYHHCPVHAINYGRITRKRGQYYFGHR